MRNSLPILFALPLIFVAVGCKSTTAEYLDEQRGYRVVSGYVKRLEGLDDPEIEKLKNGTVYTVTTEGTVVEMYFDKRDPRTRRRWRRTFELMPGDKFINSRPFSHVLIKQ